MVNLPATEERFANTLNQYLHPSSPIRRGELLQGRSQQLDQIKKSLSSPGRNVFIFGDRGVGKTSLAQTAAFLHQSTDGEPILIGCDKSSNCFAVCQMVAKKLLSQSPLENKSTKTKKICAGLKIFTAELQRSVEEGKVPLPSSVDEAIELIAFAASSHSVLPVVVVDEFERISDANQRGLFGDLIKQVGDQNINVKFIFSGVGSSLNDLLAGHESCYRYLSGVNLDRLAPEPRMEIIAVASRALGISVSRDYLVRIALISDGFPHYVHLIGSKMFWAVFEDRQGPRTEVLAKHFSKAVEDSVRDVEVHLRSLYEKASLKYNNEYQYVLWALADHPDLKRRSTDIYESYLRIMEQLGQLPLDRTKFNTRMNKLKKDNHGNVVTANRQGWYEFREPVLRGYCRLRAERQNVILERDHYLEWQKSFSKT